MYQGWFLVLSSPSYTSKVSPEALDIFAGTVARGVLERGPVLTVLVAKTFGEKFQNTGA